MNNSNLLIKVSASAFLLTAILFLCSQKAYCFYNPGTGRWLDRDPLMERGGANMYGHSKNNAVNSFDPTGLCPNCCECAVAITIQNIVENEKHPLFGFPASYLEVKIFLDYNPSEESGSATYEWWENTDHPLDALSKRGVQPNQWYNIYTVAPEDFPPPDNWKRRKQGCSPPVGRIVLDYDEPGQSADKPKRTLHMKPTIKNPPCCKEGYKRVVQATVVQTLDPKVDPPAKVGSPDPNPPTQ